MDTNSFRHSLKIPIAKITDYDWISGVKYPTFLMTKYLNEINYPFTRKATIAVFLHLLLLN
jgi:hypothetical protein